MHACMYVFVCLYTPSFRLHTYIYRYVHVYVYVYVYMYICIYVYVYMYMYICICIYMHACMSTFISKVCMSICVYEHTHSRFFVSSMMGLPPFLYLDEFLGTCSCFPHYFVLFSCC